jgi:hypothetical protein
MLSREEKKRNHAEVNRSWDIKNYDRHLEISRKASKKHYYKDSTKSRRISRKFAEENPEKRYISNHNWYLKNKEHVIAYSINYKKSNIIAYRIRFNNWQNNKKKTDIGYKIRCLLASRLCNALNRNTKFGKITSSKTYGIDSSDIIKYLVSIKPKDFNKQKYEIHHIRPIYTFNLEDEKGVQNLEEVKKAFAPENHILVTKEKHNKIHSIKENEIKFAREHGVTW